MKGVAVPVVDEFLAERAAGAQAGLRIHSHLDGEVSPAILETLGRPHRTSFYFLLYVSEGTVTYTVDLEERAVAQDEVLFVKPWQVRTPPKTKEGAQYHKLIFGPDQASRLPCHRFWLDPVGCPVVRLSPPAARRFDGTLTQLKSSLDQGSADLVLTYLNVLCTEVEVAYFSGEPFSQSDGLPAFIQFQELVERSFHRGPAIAGLAADLGMSRTKLFDLTKQWTGLSPKDYVNQRITLEAKRLLLYEQLAVKELSRRLGFFDENYFSRFFRKQTGQSVTEFLGHQKLLSRK